VAGTRTGSWIGAIGVFAWSDIHATTKSRHPKIVAPKVYFIVYRSFSAQRGDREKGRQEEGKTGRIVPFLLSSCPLVLLSSCPLVLLL
jgi:hypothetical protein